MNDIESRVKRMADIAQNIVEAWALKKYPGISILQNQDGSNRARNAYVHREFGYLLIQEVRVQFTFPGSAYGNMIVVNDDEWRKSRIIYGRHRVPKNGFTDCASANRAPLSVRTRVLALWIAKGDKAAWDAWNATRDRDQNE